MKKNYKVKRTKEATAIEILCGLIMLASFILSIILMTTDRHNGSGMLIQSMIFGFCIFLTPFLTLYKHHHVSVVAQYYGYRLLEFTPIASPYYHWHSHGWCARMVFLYLYEGQTYSLKDHLRIRNDSTSR